MKNKLKIIKKYSINLLLSFLSIILSILIMEGICRIIFDPIDYLQPKLIKNEILGTTIKPYSGGHDAWGYRNKFIPTTADIVAIGDSQTYGISATANDSWPAILQKITGKSVYNLSLGGYNPIQYSYLLENKAIKLNPSLIIVGFYYGNDLAETYSLVYTNDYWKDLRKPEFNIEQPKHNAATNTVKKNNIYKLKNLKNWLGQNCMIFRIAIRSGLGRIALFLEMKKDTPKKEISSIIDKKHNIYTSFIPQIRLPALDLDNPIIQEGLRLDLESFIKMNEFCEKENIQFLVALIPTKESVYSKYIENNTSINNSKIIDDLLANERRVNELVKIHFKEHNIDYIDTLEPLKNSIEKKQIYPAHINGHPNKNGYEIIATTIQHLITLE